MMRAAALATIALCATGAQAVDRDVPLFTFSGFGTLGVVHSPEGTADFTGSTFKGQGAGRTHAWSADPDSLLAVQLTANPAPRWSAVVQLIAEQNYANSYRPHVEWANIKYQVTPDVSVRVGRTILPLLLLTDTRKVGYAFPWVRPPVETYGLVEITSNDGVDASWRMPLVGATNTLQLTAGQRDLYFPGGDDFAAGTTNIRGLVSLVNVLEWGFATLRASYGRARITTNDLHPIFDAFRQFGPEGEAIADKYDVDSSPIRFYGVGASWDPGPWFAMAEWNAFEPHPAIGQKYAWYVSGGLRLGKFTPYATFSRAHARGQTAAGLTISALPDFLAEPAAGLNAGLNSVLASKVTQDTVSVGARWDFAKDAALKLQYDHTRIGAGSNGTVINMAPDFRTGGKLRLFSAALVFVF